MKQALIKFSTVGMHKWAAAPDHREYLRFPHRHNFFVEVTIQVWHNEREIEFHDLLQFCKDNFPQGEYKGASCETLAEQLLEKLVTEYPERLVQVSVLEDNENGAIVSNKE